MGWRDKKRVWETTTKTTTTHTRTPRQKDTTVNVGSQGFLSAFSEVFTGDEHILFLILREKTRKQIISINIKNNDNKTGNTITTTTTNTTNTITITTAANTTTKIMISDNVL